MTSRQFRMLQTGLTGIEAVEAETRHHFPRHTHTQFGIGVIHQGAQKSASGRGQVEAGIGDVITVNPGEVHDGAPIGDTGRSWRMLYLDPSIAETAMADLSEGKIHFYEFNHPVVRNAAIAQRFLGLFAAITTKVSDDSRLRQQEALLLLLNDLLATKQPQRRASTTPDISRAKQLIDDDPLASLSLSRLAKASGISQFQLVRGFAKATGLTPHAYLMQRRIDLARRLIAHGTPLVVAAIESGFADQSHMTRLFGRTHGISPGAYAAARS